MADLPEGRYRVEVDHPRLDSLGISLPAREVELRRDAEARLELAAPSKREILARLCPGGLAQRQGVLVGTVQGGAGQVQGTTVTVDWTRWDVRNEQVQSTSRPGSRGAGAPPVVVQQDRRQATATLDDQDRYRVCGVPAGVTLRVHVESPGVRGAPETVQVQAGEVRTLHLRTPVRGAGGVAAAPNGEPTVLDGVTVVAEPRDRRLEASGFYDRRKTAAGAFFAGKQLEGRDLPALIRSSGVQVRQQARGFVVLAPETRGSRAPCTLPVFVDGVPVPPSGTAALRTTTIAAVEVYREHAEVPPRFRTPGASCGAVVVWTAPSR
jgi:hypothetical protein